MKILSFVLANILFLIAQKVSAIKIGCFRKSRGSLFILPSSASTQLQLKLRLKLALFPPFPATHPATHHPPTQPLMTVVSMEVKLKTSSRLLEDYSKTNFKLK